ncbi:pre-rRNA-processing protein TSR2 homolog [Neltuma alba]|uniref:pre-rRNA-processing protein TSR2 homolog n=1 Tax=Neltuma alba TaxID=207710 RepID=UPI0010A5154D|nr:pre-rRNA-processing protein TSR2 homolog [Prosopis alba]
MRSLSRQSDGKRDVFGLRWTALSRVFVLTYYSEKKMDRRLPADSIPIFNEGIALVLHRWSALRMAVENEWGGRESRQKAERLGSDLLFWFTQSKGPLYIDDLEEKLDEGMVSLNMEVEDGSIEEVAEKLMILHEECLEGNFRSIEILREAHLKQAAHPRAMQVHMVSGFLTELLSFIIILLIKYMYLLGCDSEDDDDDEEDRARDNSNMAVEMQMPVKESIPKAAAEAGDDGWTVVSNRRNKGRN